MMMVYIIPYTKATSYISYTTKFACYYGVNNYVWLWITFIICSVFQCTKKYNQLMQHKILHTYYYFFYLGKVV